MPFTSLARFKSACCAGVRFEKPSHSDTKSVLSGRLYRQRDADLAGQLNQLEQDKANAISQAVQGVAGAAGSMPF